MVIRERLHTSMGGWNIISKIVEKQMKPLVSSGYRFISGFVVTQVSLYPLIALQYHEVKVKIQFESLIKLGVLADDYF